MVPVYSALAPKIRSWGSGSSLMEGRAFSRKDAVSWDGTGKGAGRVTSGPGLGHSGGDVLSGAVASKPISQMGRGRGGARVGCTKVWFCPERIPESSLLK